MIDCHCHILWEMDDGAESVAQAQSMALLEINEGIDIIIATPHCIDERDLETFAQRIKQRCERLQSILSEKGIDITIAPGAEVYMDPGLINMEGLERLTLNNTQYILVELPMREVPRWTQDFLYHLRLKGLIPIIAHPERNLSIIRDPDIMFRLVDLGALTQINAGSVTGFFGRRVSECAKILFTHGMGHLLGTDAHSNRKRVPCMREAVERLSVWLEPEKVEEIICVIPKKIYSGETVYPPCLVQYYKKKGISYLL